MNGAGLLCRTLAGLGVRYAFGLPGTQNVPIYEALRTSGLRSVVAADEGGAAFMAAGYARASGEVGVLTTIPGPGFVYALSGVAEAKHDSVPLLWITLRQEDTGRAYQLQRIDQVAIARTLVKRCMFVERAVDLEDTLVEGFREATAGEPGPVLVELAASVLYDEAESSGRTSCVPEPCLDAGELRRMLVQCVRPVIFCGQGAQAAAGPVLELAHRLRIPAVFTTSGRGVLPDTDPLAFVQDFSTGVGQVVPLLLERADLILALGCKFTHNGSAGGRLELPQHKLVRVDSSAEVLAANYPARLAIHARVEDVLAALSLDDLAPRQWEAAELSGLRQRLVDEIQTPINHEPVVPGLGGGSIRAFFEALATVAGDRAIYVTDAGLHQVLTRRYAVVLRPRGLLCPSDFQSMGFGLPAAIGAALAQPGAHVFACIGDAGLVLSMGELQTAMREGVNLVIVVFNDGQMNLIRRQQVTTFGRESGVRVANPDYSQLAAAVGCSYFPATGDAADLAARVVATPGVRLVELRLEDVPSLHWHQARSVVRERVRSAAPDGFWRVLKRALGR